MSQHPGSTNHSGVAHPSNDTANNGSPRPIYRPWEEVYPSLPPERQSELLALAQQQGFLLAEQIPPLTVDFVRAKLHETFNRALPSLPVLTEAIDAPTLDPIQRDAVNRALHTPDYVVVVGPPGTGKKVIAHEIIKRAAQTGERVLLLSTDPTSLDAHLPTIAGLPNVVLTRLIGAHEQATALAPEVVCFTAVEQDRAIRKQLAEKAEQELTTAEQERNRAQTAQRLWSELHVVVQQQTEQHDEQHQLTTRREALLDEIQRDADTATDPLPYFVQRLRGAASAHEKKRPALDAEAAALAQERRTTEATQASVETEVNELRCKADALTKCSVLSPGYWKAKLDKTLPTRLSEAQAKLETIQQALADISTREQKLASTHNQLDNDYDTERTKLLNDEQQRRSVTLNARATEIHQVLNDLTHRAEALRADLDAHGVALPDELTNAGCVAGVQQATQALAHAAQRWEAAREWMSMVGGVSETLVAQTRAAVNVVAGPVEVFADPSLSSTVFDWLIIDAAQQLTESSFVAAARKARRWLLLGEPPTDGFLQERSTGRHTRTDFFIRLQTALHTPVWEHDAEQLVCHLYPVHGADRKRLECEPVADSPEIELRLINLPNGVPQLAEVAFPAHYDPAKAREYLYHELQEVTPQPISRTGTWHETPDGITLRFAPPTEVFADLGGGIREELDGLHTVALHFCRSDGWGHPQAEEWATEHLTKRDSGRCINLLRPYRACPGLAQWLNVALGTTYKAALLGDPEPHVEFLAVPERERRSRDASGRSNRIGGAGYEIDLSDPRQRSSLPADLLVELPTTEWVNLHEAQAIIRYLEGMPSTSIAVTAPFAAQVALLRTMAQQSPRLQSVQFVAVDEADHIECEYLVISLTRSHVSRAVTFGESPAIIGKLLSRVRRHVLFVGDPGTLARRLQWEGPVDQLGAADAARERRWITALADCPRVSTHRSRHHAESARV